MYESSDAKITLDFSVERVRPSVTQGSAKVYCNGELIAEFGDEIKIIRAGQKYYGPIFGGWASTTPDCKFVYAALFHPHDDYYKISDGIKEVIGKMQPEEEANAKKGEENV